MSNIFQKYLLYLRLELRYSLADLHLLIISSGRNTDDEMRKILIIFYYLGATNMYMLAFCVAYTSIHIFHSCLSHPFYRLETSPILQSHVVPVFIRRIATPPNHIFLRMAMLFGVVSQRFRATNQPYHKPPFLSPVAYRPP